MTTTELREIVRDVVREMIGRELRDLARRELARLAVPVADKVAFTTEEVCQLTDLKRSSIFGLGRAGVGVLVRAPGRGRQVLWTRASVERFLASRGQALVRSERAP